MIPCRAILVASSLYGIFVDAARAPALEHAAQQFVAEAGNHEETKQQREINWYIDHTVESFYSRQLHKILSLSIYVEPVKNEISYVSLWNESSLPSDKQHIWGPVSAEAAISIAEGSKSGGYSPVLISCTGYNDSNACLITLERLGNKTYAFQCGMSYDEFAANDTMFNAQQMILRSITVYQPHNDESVEPTTCAIWLPNPYHEASLYYADSQGGFNWFNSVVQQQETKPFWHPATFSSVGDTQIYGSFVDTDIGNWSFAYDLDIADFMRKDNSMIADGFQMIALDTTTRNGNVLFAALWATHQIPTTRQWSVTGQVTGFADNNAAANSLDGMMQRFMQDTGVRQATLAASKNGTIILERGYTWAEPLRPLTNPSDAFLLASVSKMYCEAAIQFLYDTKQLSPNTKPWAEFTGYPWTGTLNDERMKDITVQQLLGHTAGFNNSVGAGDITYNMRAVSQKLDIGLPPNLSQCVDYLRDFLLGQDPGRVFDYSNVGYLVLSAVVEYVTERPYIDFITAISPSVQIWKTFAHYHTGSLTQESEYIGPPVYLPLEDPDKEPWVAAVFGGDGMWKETAVGPCGLAESAPGLALFLNDHAAWGNGPNCGWRGLSCNRAGSTPGTTTYVQSTQTCVDWALLLNTRDFAIAGDLTAMMQTIWYPIYEFMNNTDTTVSNLPLDNELCSFFEVFETWCWQSLGVDRKTTSFGADVT